MFRYLIASDTSGVLVLLLFPLLLLIASPIAAVLAARKGHWSALLFSAIALLMGAACFYMVERRWEPLIFCEIAGPILAGASVYSIIRWSQKGHSFALLFSIMSLLISAVCFYFLRRGWDPFGIF
jgi:uncharacterized membrane protein